MDRVVDRNIDEEKRGKFLTLAALIALTIFISKIIQSETQLIVSRIYLNAFFYAVFTFLGLLWAFKFQVKKRSLLFVLQPALFVFSQVLFLEFFFFQKFNRIYEAFILLILVLLVFLGNYVSFLMANVLNVDLFKKIPLAQVGRTSSYLVSLLMLYFFTFGFLVSGFPIFILIPLILISYTLVVLIHYLNMGVEGVELYRKVIMTVAISFTLFLSVFLLGDTHELVAAVPVLGYYFAVGVVSQEKLTSSNVKSLFFYFLFLFVLFALVVYLNLSV